VSDQYFRVNAPRIDCARRGSAPAWKRPVPNSGDRRYSNNCWRAPTSVRRPPTGARKGSASLHPQGPRCRPLRLLPYARKRGAVDAAWGVWPLRSTTWLR